MRHVPFFIRRLLGVLLWRMTRWWVWPRFLIACAWAGYDLPTILSRQTLPSATQMIAAIEQQADLLVRRAKILGKSKEDKETRLQKLEVLKKDRDEFRSVGRALTLLTLIQKLQNEKSWR